MSLAQPTTGFELIQDVLELVGHLSKYEESSALFIQTARCETTQQPLRRLWIESESREYAFDDKSKELWVDSIFGQAQMPTVKIV